MDHSNKRSDELEDESEVLFEELQAATELHQKILERQADIIARLRQELKGVKR